MCVVTLYDVNSKFSVCYFKKKTVEIKEIFYKIPNKNVLIPSSGYKLEGYDLQSEITQRKNPNTVILTFIFS